VRTLAELAETGDEDNVALQDAANMRARVYDDWKDGVPKGVGNTKRI
jgi:hypothetical protein